MCALLSRLPNCAVVLEALLGRGGNPQASFLINHHVLQMVAGQQPVLPTVLDLAVSCAIGRVVLSCGLVTSLLPGLDQHDLLACTCQCNG